MPFKARGRATDPLVVDRFDGGVGWIAHPDETMQRTSHVLGVDGEAWVVDPVDASVVDDLAAEFGDVAGVVVLLDRHGRDAAAVARRHEVPVYAPDAVTPDVDAPVESLDDALRGTDYRVLPVVSWPGWGEAALYDGETLVVADALGTVPYFLAPDDRLGVHPLLRLLPPAALRGLDPDRILVGHGAGVHEDATATLREALGTARRRLPAAWVRAARAAL